MHQKELAGDKSQKIAIVTTLKNPGPLLRPFIEYHLAIGFDHLFLFFDDPNDLSIAEAQQYDNVMAIKNDAELHRKWTKKEAYAQIGHLVDTEIMARQRINVEVALDLARRRSFDWLLHIDVDELFYSPTHSVKEHFRMLADQGIDQSLYINYEAIPESADIFNPFKEVTLFKKHPQALPRGKISDQQLQIINLCPHLMRNRFFFYHRDTKAAVRLRDGIRTHGTHKFLLPEDPGSRERILRRVSATRAVRLAAKAMPRVYTFLSGKLYREKSITSKDPFILHYPACGFEQFWAKYITWGRFPVTIWGGKGNWIQVAGSFHIESRDIVMQGDRDLAREFYESRYVMSDEEEVRRLSDAGLICRIEAPARLLAKSYEKTRHEELAKITKQTESL
jgi:hypothetical protein